MGSVLPCQKRRLVSSPDPVASTTEVVSKEAVAKSIDLSDSFEGANPVDENTGHSLSKMAAICDEEIENAKIRRMAKKARLYMPVRG